MGHKKNVNTEPSRKNELRSPQINPHLLLNNGFKRGNGSMSINSYMDP